MWKRAGFVGALAVAAAGFVACSSGDDGAAAQQGSASSATSSSGTGGGGAAASSSSTGGGGAGGGGAGGGCVDPDALPLLDTPPAMLSGTGLYVNGQLAPYVRHFVPEYPLWSDGATKERWAYLPKCGSIDTTDMDHWVMPVGARFWKQFTRDGTLVETRFIHRFGPTTSDWIFAAYQWDPNDPSKDAVWVPNGVPDANNTPHDIPDEGKCKNCHTKLKERILGFSAIQLSYAAANGDESIASLSAAGLLTVPAPQGFDPPGNAVEQAALGYLHANCGNCHNDSGVGQVDMWLRLLVGQKTVADTDAVKTAVDRHATNYQCNGCYRIEPGDAANSAIIQRMNVRGTSAQMPPIASEVVDDTGVQKVTDWIGSMPVCAATGEACNGTIGCCSGSCVGQVCVDECTTAAQPCADNTECCTGVCAGTCACSGDFQPCATDADCCGNVGCDTSSGMCL